MRHQYHAAVIGGANRGRFASNRPGTFDPFQRRTHDAAAGGRRCGHDAPPAAIEPRTVAESSIRRTDYRPTRDGREADPNRRGDDHPRQLRHVNHAGAASSGRGIEPARGERPLRSRANNRANRRRFVPAGCDEPHAAEANATQSSGLFINFPLFGMLPSGALHAP